MTRLAPALLLLMFAACRVPVEPPKTSGFCASPGVVCQSEVAQAAAPARLEPSPEPVAAPAMPTEGAACEDRAKVENEERDQKHVQSVEQWLADHPVEAKEIEGEYGGALAAAKQVEATPDQSAAPDSYAGRYYVDGKGFEGNDEAGARRLRYLACALTRGSGCDGPMANSQIAGRMAIMGFMQRQKRLSDLGFPARGSEVHCGRDGELEEQRH